MSTSHATGERCSRSDALNAASETAVHTTVAMMSHAVVVADVVGDEQQHRDDRAEDPGGHELGPVPRRAERPGRAATVSSEEVGRGKPAPDVYLEAVRRLGAADPAAAVAVEDSENGIRSAHAAGMRVLAVPNLAPARRRGGRAGDAVLRSPARRASGGRCRARAARRSSSVASKPE